MAGSLTDDYAKAGQEALKALGHYNGEVDGNIYKEGWREKNDDFSNAVREFQKANTPLKPDGRLGKKSLDVFFKEEIFEPLEK